MAEQLRVAAVQMQHVPGDRVANLLLARHLVREAVRQGARWVVFPECNLTGYWHLRKLDRASLEQLAESVPDGPSTQALLRLARHHDVLIGCGLIERDADGRLFNTYVVAMPDGRHAAHRKLHCFISPHLESGDRITVFASPEGWPTAVLICYDNNLVENVRLCALEGAEVLLAPHQTGGCRSRSPHAMGVVPRSAWGQRAEFPDVIQAELLGDKGRGWLMRWLPARAHDNGLFLIFSNGIGPDDDEVRTGNAMILDPYGRVLAETSRAGDDVVIADLDRRLRETSTGARWLTARRPELYRRLAEPTGRERPIRQVRFEPLQNSAPQTTASQTSAPQSPTPQNSPPQNSTTQNSAPGHGDPSSS